MNRYFLAASAVAAVVMLSGCGGNTKALVGQHDPRVRLLNTLNSPGRVEGVIDNTTVLHNAAFGAVSTDQIVPNGNRTVSFFDSVTQGMVASGTALYREGKHYTAIGGGSPGARVVDQFEDDLTSPANGNGNVRAINMAYGQGTLDVYITDPSVSSLNGLTPTVAGLAYESASSTYIPFPAGTYRIRATAPGSSTAIVDKPLILPAGAIRTLVLVSAPAGPDVFVLTDQG